MPPSWCPAPTATLRPQWGSAAAPGSPSRPCGHSHLAGLHKACPLPGAGPSAHFRSPATRRRAAWTSPRPPQAPPLRTHCGVLLSHARLPPHPGASPTPQSLALSPENVSQKHQDVRPSRQPPPHPLPSTAQERGAAGSLSLGLQPWSSWEPQRQTSLRGATSPGPLRSTALSWDAGGTTWSTGEVSALALPPGGVSVTNGG